MDEGAGGNAVDAEREALLFFLNRVRDAVVRVSEGLSEDALRSPGVPSGTNLLGLVWHLKAMEVHWFRRVFRGEDCAENASMAVPATVTREEVVAAYRRACADSDRIVRTCPELSMLAKASNPGEDRKASMRRIVVHMIEETARHAGHADILREQSDGATDL